MSFQYCAHCMDRLLRENGTACIIMEYPDGITMKNYIRQCGLITP